MGGKKCEFVSEIKQERGNKIQVGNGEDERGQFNVGIWLNLYFRFVYDSVVTSSDDFT